MSSQNLKQEIFALGQIFGKVGVHNIVGWMQEGRKCILMIFQEERFSVLQ